MGTILSRIQDLAQHEGITIGALERSIGASKGVLSRAINNNTDIQSKWLHAIVENYPQYSGEWLLSGRGYMLYKQESSEQSSSSARSGDVEAFLSHMAGKDETIMKQAKEIGRLEAEVELITAERDAAIAAAERARTNMTA